MDRYVKLGSLMAGLPGHLDVRHSFEVMECSTCGAVVRNIEVHDRWHDDAHRPVVGLSERAAFTATEPPLGRIVPDVPHRPSAAQIATRR